MRPDPSGASHDWVAEGRTVEAVDPALIRESRYQPLVFV
jgi:hypothetical protein